MTRKERETRSVFFAVAKRIAACGPYTLTTWKFGVTFVAKQEFAWVNHNMAGRLDIHFVLPRRLESERIWRIDRAPGGFTHHVREVTIATVDDEIGGWLRASYVDHGQRTPATQT